jgi:hypothetical protein
MKRYVPLIGVAAVGLAAPAAADTGRPALKALGLQPLSIEGTHFKPDESIVVRVQGGTRPAAKRVTATADGTWTVTFPTLKARGITVSVRATGDAGSSALWWPRVLRPTPISPIVRPTPHH